MSADALIDRYRNKGILIDSNLLVLLATGAFRRSLIPRFNRTRQYTADDFELLVRLVDLFSKRVVTPHIVAEADNLMRQLPQAEHSGVAAVIAAIVADAFEVYVPSTDAMKHERYASLGATDCTIVLASQDVLVITGDFRLSSILTHLGRDAININHLRQI
jgi:hypothetical protein